MFKRHFTAQFANSSSEITTVGMLQMNSFRSKCVVFQKSCLAFSCRSCLSVVLAVDVTVGCVKQ